MTPPHPLPSVAAGKFEGPLDLLLEEVRRQKVAIEEVNLAPAVGRFLEYLRTAKASNLNLDIGWLQMAATLVYWKSRALLPVAPGSRKVSADPLRDELVRQLQAHRKQLAGELARRKLGEERQYSRTLGVPGDSRPADDAQEIPAFESVWDLLQQARELGRWIGDQKAVRRDLQRTWGVAAEEVTISEMSEWLLAELEASGGRPLDGLMLLNKQSSRSRRNCLFLALLELARADRVEIKQNECFGAMWLASTCLQ
jgi:segregation and condensation protein A